ncbi:MAG: serine O-acetyltransferase [Candidatus Solincola sediminis]|uniref:Serine acetyltransferase n=1 Tax=Candidatus Solincola sediminis TaxID=1797199 RepID=A0A1F2WRA4_9ACTN|nr:MAG: serine O-acetyltransferase [Candidatus Solincola sediminis]
MSTIKGFLQRNIELLREDVEAVKERDPAARGTLEIMLTYPGLHAIWLHRLAHALLHWHVPLVPRLLSIWARFRTGVEIHEGAHIGRGLFIDHGMGVVIGETAEVGENVTIYQEVTLGGTGKKRGKRHPTIGDNVVLASGAKVLGDIYIGDNAKIGAGSVVLQDVPANCTVVGVPGRIKTCNGERVPDLRHDRLPDPELDILLAMNERLSKLEEVVLHGDRP